MTRDRDDCWSIFALENVNSLAASIALKTSEKKKARFEGGPKCCCGVGLMNKAQLLMFGRAEIRSSPHSGICNGRCVRKSRKLNNVKISQKFV
jgi:hypothetical protein